MTQAAPRLKYRPEIDGVRAIADFMLGGSGRVQRPGRSADRKRGGADSGDAGDAAGAADEDRR